MLSVKITRVNTFNTFKQLRPDGEKQLLRARYYRDGYPHSLSTELFIVP